MESWEKLIINNPTKVLDSLKQFDKVILSDGNSAYRNLLTSIAKEKSGIRERNVENITISEKWYKEHGKRLSYCKALLYRGIIISNKSSLDTVAFSYILKADSLYHEYKLNDQFFISKCYEYKSRILRAQKAYPQAELYLEKAIKTSTLLKDSAGLVQLKLKQFKLYLNTGKLSKAFKNITEFQIEQDPTPQMQYEISNAFYIYYLATKEYDVAASYLRRMINISAKYDIPDIDYNTLNFRLANFYEGHHERDSALMYYSKIKDTGKDTLKSIMPAFYSRFASFMVESGDYKTAYEYEKQAYETYLKLSNRKVRERLLEIDNKNELQILSSRLSKTEQLNAILLILIILSGGGITYIFLRRIWLKRSKKDVGDIEDNNWLIREINKASAGALPKLIEDVFDEADKCRKVNPQVSDHLLKSVKSSRDEIKAQFQLIVNHPKFLEAYPYASYMTNCTPLETIMHVLVKNGYSTKEIASMLTIQNSSVRARKSKIKDAINDNKDIPEDQKERMLFY